MISTLVVDDSPIICRIISTLLKSDKRFSVAGTASNGLEAIEKTEELKPDLIIMDINMPVMNGLEATSIISKKFDSAIVAFTTEDAADVGFKCIESGALELIQKPDMKHRGDEYYTYFLDRLFLLADRHRKLCKIKSDTPKSQCATPDAQQKKELKVDSTKSKKTDVISDVYSQRHFTPIAEQKNWIAILIGASTGGPSAIQTILKNIKSSITVPIFITQHIDKFYDMQFVKWLDSTTPLSVEIAEDGKEALPGRVYVAPAESHLTFEKHEAGKKIKMKLDHGPEVHYLKPSVDVMFSSAAQNLGDRILSVILTGMGRDGAEGMLKIKNSGGYTIAQDEGSCIVYGMPKASVDNGSIKQIVSLSEISVLLNETVL